MQDLVMITQDYLSSSSNKYAKLFTMRKHFLGQASWHRNQLVFELIHASSLAKCIIKRYFLSLYESSGTGATTIVFREMGSNPSGIDCVYVDNEDDTITVYAKGSLDGANIRLKPIYAPVIGKIEFYNYQPCTTDLSEVTTVSPVVEDTDALPTFSNARGTIANTFNRIKKQGNVVVVNLCIANNSVTISDGMVLCKLPTGSRPLSNLHGDFLYKKSDGTYASGKIIIMSESNYGDILAYGVTSGSTEFYINVTFTV